jgi:hypothetical protein
MTGTQRTVASKSSATGGQTRFAIAPQAEIQRSVFDRSFSLKTAFNASVLIPIFVDEALPGDTMSLNLQHFARMATPLYPVMDNMYMDVFFFSVPNRLIWDNWVKFNGEQDDPGDTTDYTVPQVTAPTGGWTQDSVGDYFGLPIGVERDVNALPFRAMNLVYNQWFRDENLIDSLTVNKGDGPDPDTDYTILKRGKRHDYFTSALPFAQKGASVLLPLGVSAPVTGSIVGDGSGPLFDEVGGASDLKIGSYDGAAAGVATDPGFSGAGNQMTWNTPHLSFTDGVTDLSAATAATINEIREAFQVQRLFERDARGGTRYTEILRSHFGVVSPDARLQRAEYLGGGTHIINTHPVASTNRYTNENEIGDLGGFTTTGGATSFFKSFTEHCTVVGFACIRADLHYQQGINKMWLRTGRFDYFWPALAHLGEQEVQSMEIYADGTGDPDADPPTGDFSTFGYQERFAEYRYKPSMITGTMRSTATLPLDQWHLAQEFGSRPLLNQTFIEEDVPIDRVLAITSGQPEFLFDGWFTFKHARPMPTYSVPGLVDHF